WHLLKTRNHLDAVLLRLAQPWRGDRRSLASQAWRGDRVRALDVWLGGSGETGDAANVQRNFLGDGVERLASCAILIAASPWPSCWRSVSNMPDNGAGISATASWSSGSAAARLAPMA